MIPDSSKYCGYCGNVMVSKEIVQRQQPVQNQGIVQNQGMVQNQQPVQNQQNTANRGLLNNKIVLGVAGIILAVLIGFMIIHFFGNEDIFMQGVEFGMSKSEVASKVKLDNLYNESDYYLGYAPFAALKIDDKDIAAEVQFSFTGDDKLYQIEYQFEGEDVDTEIVVDYINKKYSGEDVVFQGSKATGEKESSDYYLTVNGHTVTLKSKEYSNTDSYQ